ncbi:serine/threonine protein kinase [Pseudosporangium ferrugineum]|uniref:Serine/threonine protein kinase n=1 Tax=Pseudosporangium ferrugineum TaxID=439699 RepID=A0A2T0RXH4_9ACTN|nr:discoidin domain-containing protein [Pseudosporangium ferrugineum]PRY25832.1 serine/threonine protein kinase [Pseudosporangium ferrugineum]
MDHAYRVSPLRSADPTRLGDYELIGRLGAGGMGVVYLARDAAGLPAAIKLIHPGLTADPEFVARFHSEVARARQVPPYCTAEFLDADLDHEPPYLVVEYVDGPSLPEIVEERGPLTGGALHSLAVGVATALTGIHGAHVIHRDLKPDNVLLPPSGPKVIDFGIARPFAPTRALTHVDMMVGTVAYMAPERFSDQEVPVSSAADVFSWGCVIAYAGTGRTLFRGDSPSATAGRILTHQPELDGLPDSLRPIVRLALAKDPADRPAAADLLGMLVGRIPVPAPGSAAASGTGAGLPAARKPRSRRILAGGVAVLAAVGAFAALRGPGERGPDTAPPSNDRNPVALHSGGSASPTAARSARTPPADRMSLARPSATASSREAGSTRPPASKSAGKPRAAVNTSGRNLALHRPAAASTSEGDAWAAPNAVDGDGSTRWGSAWNDPQWLRVDLGGRWQITEIVVRWERAYAKSYRVEISADGSRWSTVFRTSAGAGGTVRVPVDRSTGRYVRVYGTQRSGGYGYSLYELEVR